MIGELIAELLRGAISVEPVTSGRRPPLHWRFCRWLGAMSLMGLSLGFIRVEPAPEKYESGRPLIWQERGRLGASYEVGAWGGASVMLLAVLAPLVVAFVYQSGGSGDRGPSRLTLAREVTVELHAYQRRTDGRYHLKEYGAEVVIRQYGEVLELDVPTHTDELDEGAGEYDRVRLAKASGGVRVIAEANYNVPSYAEGRSPYPIEVSYTARIESGSWEGFQNGEPLTLFPSAKGREARRRAIRSKARVLAMAVKHQEGFGSFEIMVPSLPEYTIHVDRKKLSYEYEGPVRTKIRLW